MILVGEKSPFCFYVYMSTDIVNTKDLVKIKIVNVMVVEGLLKINSKFSLNTLLTMNAKIVHVFAFASEGFQK